MPHEISPSPRIRRSPYYAATLEEGVTAFSTYNHMLMPTSYGDPEAEYRRLVEGVAMWDVAVERQVELTGPDAGRLAQILTPRRLDRLAVGTGWYVPVCDHRGVLINDPVLLKHAEDRYWFSIADGDLLLWARAIAAERGLDVTVVEPEVAPLAVQGPRAEDVIAALFGEEIRAIRHFRFREVELDGIPLVLARSGWSRQGGFELYLLEPSRGVDLWHRVRAAGRPFDIGPGAPNPAERIESGLLSWGGDTDDATTPFEVRMSRYVHLDAPAEVVGIDALRRIARAGPARHQLGAVFDAGGPLAAPDLWCQVTLEGTLLGHVTARAFSPRLGTIVGMCLVDRRLRPGDRVGVSLPDGAAAAATLAGFPLV